MVGFIRLVRFRLVSLRNIVFYNFLEEISLNLCVFSLGRGR